MDKVDIVQQTAEAIAEVGEISTADLAARLGIAYQAAAARVAALKLDNRYILGHRRADRTPGRRGATAILFRVEARPVATQE